MDFLINPIMLKYLQCTLQLCKYYLLKGVLQYNLNGSNMDGSFTVDDSNSFFSPYKILPVAQKKQIFRDFSYFIMELYVVCTH